MSGEIKVLEVSPQTFKRIVFEKVCRENPTASFKEVLFLAREMIAKATWHKALQKKES